MIADFKIKIDNTFYDREWILNNFRNLDRDKYSDSVLAVLEFLYKWFSGKESFEIRTSGSTGSPKSLTIQKRQMILSAQKTNNALNLKPGDRALLCISPQYIGGLMMIVRSLVGDLRLTVVEASANPFEKIVPDEAFDFMALVPLQLENILDNETSLQRLNAMKAVIVGGAQISPILELAARNIKAPVYQTFGMTETISHIALRRISGPKAEKEYKVLPDVKISQDKRGCLEIESDIIAGQKLVTNDLVELTAFNKFNWIGRVDNLINSGGIKINPEKVEQVISELISGSIEKMNFFVAGLPDGSLGEKVVAVFEKSVQSLIKKDVLLKSLREKLPQYEVPKEIYFVEELVRTSTGKLSRLATLSLVRNNK